LTTVFGGGAYLMTSVSGGGAYLMTSVSGGGAYLMTCFWRRGLLDDLCFGRRGLLDDHCFLRRGLLDDHNLQGLLENQAVDGGGRRATNVGGAGVKKGGASNKLARRSEIPTSTTGRGSGGGERKWGVENSQDHC